MGLFDRIAAWFDQPPAPVGSSAVSKSVDINPASGLPTIAGAGTPDIAGNAYGVSRSHDHEYDWQRHDRWDSSAHDYFHHDSSSASSHDPWRY